MNSRSEAEKWLRFFFGWMAFSFVVHMITAVYSVGYHSADENFQIIEFLSFKLGKTPAKFLAVEFTERMRPWLQPWIYYGITQLMQGLGDQSPFHWAMGFRIFDGIVGWLSGVLMIACAPIWFPIRNLNAKRAAWRFLAVAVATMWFLPAMHVRPSSEGLSGSCFILGACLITLGLKKAQRWQSSKITASFWILTGALLGASFEFRFQSGLMIAGALAWMLFCGRAKWQPFVQVLIGIALVFILGRCVDHWAYGEWVLSPWRYIQYNLIRGEVSRYGRLPWWDIVRMSFTESWPFIGTALLFATLIAWIRNPLHLFTWSQVPFFIVHELIAHKELRFFFPIAMAGPLMLTLALYSSKSGEFFDWSHLKSKWLRWPSQGLWYFLLANNGIGLLVLAFVPFSRVVQYYEGVYHAIPPETKTFELYVKARDPYEILGTPVFFYRPPQLEVKRFGSYGELRVKLDRGESPFWLYEGKFTLPTEADSIASRCKSVFQTLPPWITYLNFNNWLDRANAWTLFRCE